jgi:hypothetical protein
MSAQLAPQPVFQAFAPSGAPLVGGQLFTFIAGTNTPQATYVDSTQTTQNTNPVILNTLGEANVWLNPGLAYKFVLQDAAGNQLWSVDNILGALSQSNLIVGPPSSGTALTVISANVATNPAINVLGTVQFTNSGRPLLALNSAGAGYSLLQNDSPLTWSIAYTSSSAPFNNGTPIIQWNSSGNVIIPAPTTGTGLRVFGEPGGGTALVVSGVGFGTNAVAAITNQNVPGQSSGLAIFAGVTAADNSFRVVNAALTQQLLNLNGVGQLTVFGSITSAASFIVGSQVQPIWAAPLAGWGTVSGVSGPVANFPGAGPATLAQCSSAIAQILQTLKNAGVYAT